ncbi:hypothetical protein DPMN_066746 [Dreissena polymorpha]|uniref:Uncharacterized protein n=1 Tax=Dreissena polymorpha TaxID=45954 RepID=A0A9D4BT21_DREPO|nr:hypothetical protein DPMN_066746 [Dreissena polymorpha]
MDGTLISTLISNQLQGPWGVHVTPAGQVLVCGFQCHSVIQVDREGRNKMATLLSQIKGRSRSAAVCANKNIDQIMVGLENNNNIIFVGVTMSGLRVL